MLVETEVKGVNEENFGEPVVVTVELLTLLSAKYPLEVDEFNNNDVPLIAVKGELGTVKFEVYSAVPLTTLTLEMLPL